MSGVVPEFVLFVWSRPAVGAGSRVHSNTTALPANFQVLSLIGCKCPLGFLQGSNTGSEYVACSTRVQITSAYFAAIITESGKICACAGTSSGRYRPRVGTQRYLPVLPSTCFDGHNMIPINLLNLPKYLEAKFNYMEVTSSADP